MYLFPNIQNLPPNFTLELEAVHSAHGVAQTWDFYDKKQSTIMSLHLNRNYDDFGVHARTPEEHFVDQDFKGINLNQPVKLALWLQKGRLRIYLNEQRIADANQLQFPEIESIRVRLGVGDHPETDYLGYRMVRFAESQPDFSQVISSSGRWVTHGILFDTDSDRIKPESAPDIKMIAGGLESNPALKLLIEGHTDSTGNADHNLDLSKRRAEAVKNEELIATAKAQFPKSAFKDTHAAWYRSQARRGLLTSTSIAIPAQRQPKSHN